VPGKFKKAPLHHPEARGVAVKKQPFGEGGERLAYQFFEIAEDGKTVVGDPLVAKVSRFVEERENNKTSDWEDHDKFARRFCTLQHRARKAAVAFNEKLDGIAFLDDDTARVAFLDCSVYYMSDPEKGEHSVIVERRLDGHFQKWNTNNGVSICSTVVLLKFPIFALVSLSLIPTIRSCIISNVYVVVP
jgi:hypothetical protein